MVGMDLLIDEYRKGWALRFIREARTDLLKAEETPIQNMSVSFALVSMKKAQTAIYYSLGDPEQLAFVVRAAMEEKERIKDPLMILLTQIEQFIHAMNGMAAMLRNDIIIEDAKQLIEVASEIVELMVGRTV